MTDPIRALERLIKAIEEIELEGVPEVDDAITAAHDTLVKAGPASVVQDSLTTVPPELQRPWSGEVAAWSAKLRPADSTPPAEGKVAELVKWLGSHAADWEEVGLVEWADKCTRIQALLEQLHPAPVAVSERLPGPEDCNTEGLCWVWNRTAYTWGLFRLDLTAHSHWLPFHALPLPTEGEGKA